jgi:hypothetical protein
LSASTAIKSGAEYAVIFVGSSFLSASQPKQIKARRRLPFLSSLNSENQQRQLLDAALNTNTTMSLATYW